ncbi:MAG: ABC transporter substrate-binding protein, partial [Microbacterium sp.]|nr:ABC transporter substrate-binding protein [Microbacterium sp.]
MVAMASVVALALAGCSRGGGGNDSSASSAASPGITDTSITLGITTPLSGATAGPGTCTVAGITAYFGEKNAKDGGVKFGDGKTRKVTIKALDDAYDPQKAKANYDQLKDSVFAMTAGLGTPTNRAWREAATMHLTGMAINFMIAVLLLAVFVGRMSASLNTQREAIRRLHE